MISGNMLILIAVAILALFIGFGFLLGFLRGFRKSLFFTIVFIVVVLISFIFATALAKSVYGGSTLWKFAKGAIPESMKEGAEGVNSLKEFIRFYIEHNYTEVLENGMTAGQSIVANEDAMAIIDGLIVMILKIAMLIGGYIILSILFYIVFGLIYLLFLRPKTYIETETTTDEDGNESVTEREVKPKKKRLSGGLIGAAKGFVKAMIILIPMSFAIGMMAQVRIPSDSPSTNSEVRLAEGSSDTTLQQIVEACRQYDNSLGKMYLGLDDAVMDQIISYKVDGKKITLRKEVKGFINIYNAIDENIGMDNVKDYDFKNNLNSQEMRNVVEAITKNISESNATTTLLTAVGSELTTILQDKASKNDPDIALLFTELNLKDKDSDWWKNQISQLNDIYNAFADMNLYFEALDSKEYNMLFKDTTSEKFDAFVDELFNNELIEMLADGGLKLAVAKLPEGYSDVATTTNQVIADKEVEEEIKSFSVLIDIIRDDMKFNDGTLDTDGISIGTLHKLVANDDKAILLKSKIVAKFTTSLLKNTLNEITYNGELINYNTTMFDDASFVIHNELKSLVNVLEEGFGLEYSIGNLKDLEGTSEVGQICDMLDSDGLSNSKIANELFSKFLPLVLKTITPDESYDNIVWSNEYKSISGVLENIYGRSEKVSNLTSFDFEALTFRKLDNLAECTKVWNGQVVPKMLNSLALPYIRGLVTNQDKVDMNYSASDFTWNNELKKIVNLGVTVADTDGIIDDVDYNQNVGSLTGALDSAIGDLTLKALRDNVPTSYILQDIFSDTLITSDLIDYESEIINWNLEMSGLITVAITMEDENNKLDLNTLNDIQKVTTETVEELEVNTHKSIILMNTMAKTLAEPMDTPSMKNENNKSAWTSPKWEKEMPRICDVLLTMADDHNEIVVNDLEMGEEDEIKLETFKSIEKNIAYSEALENMFKKTMEDAIYDEENSLDSLPTVPAFNDEEERNEWWYAEITGLLNVVYAQMGSDTKLRLNEFTDTDEVKVKVIKALTQKAIYTHEVDGEIVHEQKTKVYSSTFSQETNVGVSEYLQYLFKPQLRDVSRRSTVSTDPLYNVYYDFYQDGIPFRWDVEMEPVLNMFLITRMSYDTTTHELSHLDDESIIKFGDISFGLFDNGSIIDGRVIDGAEARARNFERIKGINENIDDISYLQFILVPEMDKMMYKVKDEFDVVIKDYSIEGHRPNDWDNDAWIREMGLLYNVSERLMTDENPKMSNIKLYTLSQEDIDLICESAAQSYLLQSKMVQSLISAGIDRDDITSTASLTETKGYDKLIDYIFNHEWNNGVNEAYKVVLDTLCDNFEAFKAMNNNWFERDSVEGKLSFYDDETERTEEHEVATIKLSPVEAKNKNGGDLLTNDASTELLAIKSYAEFNLMITALLKTGDPWLLTAANNLKPIANALVYSE